MKEPFIYESEENFTSEEDTGVNGATNEQAVQNSGTLIPPRDTSTTSEGATTEQEAESPNVRVPVSQKIIVRTRSGRVIKPPSYLKMYETN